MDAFLSKCGLATSQRLALRATASPKKYWRIAAGSETWIVLETSLQTLAAMVRAYKLYRQSQIRVPEIYHYDLQTGYALLEDMGDTSLSSLIKDSFISFSHEQFITEAVDIAARLQSVVHLASDLPTMTFDDYLVELSTVTEWYIPYISGNHSNKNLIADFFDAIKSVEHLSNLLPRFVVHRDFYADNLMVTHSDAGDYLCVIDYEETCKGSPVYDLMSLLQDHRRAIDPDLEERMISRYLLATGLPRSEFELEYAVYGVLRGFRVLGLWQRLKHRDGKADYVSYEPYTRRQLEKSLRHPAMANVRRMYQDKIASLGE